MSPDTFAWDLIDHVSSLYGSCSTYQDTGEVTLVFDELPSGPQTEKTRFRTAFVRPDRFFFESRRVSEGPEPEWRRDVIWIDASGIRSWRHVGSRLADHESVVEAAAALGGASHGASAFIPWLLRIGDRSPSPLPDPLAAKHVGTGESDGRACDRIEGVKSGEHHIVWIERGTRLVLKVEVSHEFDEAHFVAHAEAGRSALASMKPDDPGRASLERMLEAFVDHRPEAFRTKRTTVWQPMMDQPVDPAIFEITPPTSSGRP